MADTNQFGGDYTDLRGNPRPLKEPYPDQGPGRPAVHHWGRRRFEQVTAALFGESIYPEESEMITPDYAARDFSGTFGRFTSFGWYRERAL